MDSRRILRNHVKPAAEQAGITKRVYLYLLRHTFGTRAVAATDDPKKVSEIMGHESVEFTLDTYVHNDEEELREAAEAMDSLLSTQDNSGEG